MWPFSYLKEKVKSLLLLEDTYTEQFGYHKAQSLVLPADEYEFKKEGDGITVVHVPKKECGTCYERKPLDEFYKDTRAKDKKTWSCKACMKSYNTAYQQKKKQIATLQEVVTQSEELGLYTGTLSESKELVFTPAPKSKLQQFLEDTPSLEQRLLDALDDLDILATRIAKLQAEVNTQKNG